MNGTLWKRYRSLDIVIPQLIGAVQVATIFFQKVVLVLIFGSSQMDAKKG